MPFLLSYVTCRLAIPRSALFPFTPPNEEWEETVRLAQTEGNLPPETVSVLPRRRQAATVWAAVGTVCVAYLAFGARRGEGDVLDRVLRLPASESAWVGAVMAFPIAGLVYTGAELGAGKPLWPVVGLAALVAGRYRGLVVGSQSLRIE